MSQRNQFGIRAGVGALLAALAIASVAPSTSRPVRAAAQADVDTSEAYASPLEVLLSPDGAPAERRGACAGCG